MKRRGVEHVRYRVAEMPADLTGRSNHRRMLTAAKDRLLERSGDVPMPDTWAMFCDRENDWEPLITASVAVGPQQFLQEAQHRSLRVTDLKTPRGAISHASRRALHALRDQYAALLDDLPDNVYKKWITANSGRQVVAAKC